MTKFFKPIDFEEQEKDTHKELNEKLGTRYQIPTKWEFDEEKFNEAIKKINKEIELLIVGGSEYRGGALHGTIPAVNALNTLKVIRTRHQTEMFIKIASQDFGKRAGKAFEQWFEGVFKEITDE